MRLADLNALAPGDARAALLACCGSSRWVDAMVARRPFADPDALAAAADAVWWSLAPADWLEAFAHHPRIGERRAAAPVGDRARAWSGGEQAGVAGAGADVAAALAAGNRAYEARFGHVFLVCATGKTAAEMLAILEARLANDADAELRVAAGEQAKITRLRLAKLVAD